MDEAMRRFHCPDCGWNYWLPPRLGYWLTEHRARKHGVENSSSEALDNNRR